MQGHIFCYRACCTTGRYIGGWEKLQNVNNTMSEYVLKVNNFESILELQVKGVDSAVKVAYLLVLITVTCSKKELVTGYRYKVTSRFL